MRKLSYFLTFLAVAATLALNIASLRMTSWFVARYPEVLRTKVTVYYGLMEACTLQVVSVPSPTEGRIDYTNYSCKSFPSRKDDRCEKENRYFCTAWTSAGYAVYLSIGFASVTLLTLLFGVSTHSRRRRIWRAVSGLVGLHAASQMIAFSIMTDLYRTSNYPAFEQARFGAAYYINAVSWVLAFFVMFGVITTGISADKGHRWAAGNRAYQPISS